MELIVETSEREKAGVRNITNSVYADSKHFLYIHSYYAKNRKRSIYAYLWWPTSAIREDLLPEFEKLYEQLRIYKPAEYYTKDTNTVSFCLINQSNLNMYTGYGSFELKRSGRGKRITIETPFNISRFIAPLISKTAIVERIPETSLKETLEKILSKHKKLKPY